jgi:hypothetical protein
VQAVYNVDGGQELVIVGNTITCLRSEDGGIVAKIEIFRVVLSVLDIHCFS